MKTRSAPLLVFCLLLSFASASVVAAQTPSPAASPVPTQDPSAAKTPQEQIYDLIIQATRLQVKSDYVGALPFLQQALEIAEKAFGADDILVYLSLKSIGTLYTDKGDYLLAEPILQRALEIMEKRNAMGLSEIDPKFYKNETAEALHKLALAYDYLADYGRAEPLYERSLALREEALGPDSLEVARSANFLANVYMEKGDYPRAGALFQRAMDINEKQPQPDQMLIASLLNNLGMVYEAQKEHAKAEPLFLRAIAITEKVKPESVDLATFLNNLGTMYSATDRKKARPILERALTLVETLFGKDGAEVVSAVNNLAILSWREGDLRQTESSLLRARSVMEKTHGPTHPSVATVLKNLAFLYQAKGDIGQAVSFLSRANEVREHNLGPILSRGTEEQKRLYMATFTDETSATISLHVNSARENPAAVRLALTTILQRKGRILDALSNQFASLRNHLSPPDQLLLDQLSLTRTQLANLVLTGPDTADPTPYAVALKTLESKAQAAEKQLATRAGEFRLQTEPITIEGIQALIPQNTALIEIARYRPVAIEMGKDPGWKPDRYVAYVLKHQGEPSWVELGDAAQIDRDANRLRAALRNPRRSDFREVARAVDEVVMRPVRKLLGSSKEILISPDGDLNLIPLAALIDEQQHFLVENFTFTYLSSGRDLLRLQNPPASGHQAVVIADPQFDEPRKSNAAVMPVSRGSGQRSMDFQERFAPLAATADEAQAVSGLLPGATVLLREHATEKALKQLDGPGILHVATHGFFLPRPPVGQTVMRGERSLSGQTGTSVRFTENPLLRSGLALAGANERQGGDGEDGILTALEAAGLKLWGTRLVVLSACETGIGDVQNGEGVYGLRRALVLAGAESELMSLWKVDDEATRDLMTGFYKNLQSGVGRTEALRRVQLVLLNGEDHSHPSFWAAFILSGDWRPLKLK
jgi:CHAT domain-containing protein/Tfp pilus assembly protein PilF